MSQAPEESPLVREGTLELKLKVLEQRLTIKLIVGLVAASAAPHLSIPGSVTAGVLLGVAYKLAALRVAF